MTFSPGRRGRVLGLVGCAADGLHDLGAELVEPLIGTGWQVGITLTPAAHRWLAATGEIAALESLTGLPVRWSPRLPGEPRPHPQATAFAVVPATATSVAKLALGIGDNQALTSVCEAIGTKDVPVIAFPRVNAAHARHPAWAGHIAALTSAGVRLIHGPDVWPLAEPRAEPPQPLPWATIRAAIDVL